MKENKKQKYLDYTGEDLVSEFGFDEGKVNKLYDEGYITWEALHEYNMCLDEAEAMGLDE